MCDHRILNHSLGKPHKMPKAKKSENPYHQWDQWLHLKSELCRSTNIPIEVVHRSSPSSTPNQISSNPLISTSSFNLQYTPLSELNHRSILQKQKKNQVNPLEAIFDHLNKSNLPIKKMHTPWFHSQTINMRNTPQYKKTMK